MKPTALLACLALLAGTSGCFGYNSSAKGWAYAGDAILIVGGGAAIAADEATKGPACTGPGCPYKAPVEGAIVVGAVLIAAGIAGIIYNATRTNVKTSR